MEFPSVQKNVSRVVNVSVTAIVVREEFQPIGPVRVDVHTVLNTVVNVLVIGTSVSETPVMVVREGFLVWLPETDEVEPGFAVMVEAEPDIVVVKLEHWTMVLT